MTPKTIYILLVLLSGLCLGVCQARAECIEFTADGVIEDGDTYECVRILNDATVDMTGGYIIEYITLNDTGTLNFSGGSVDSIWARHSTALNITGGTLVDQLTIRDSSLVNIYDVEMTAPYNFLEACRGGTLNIYGGNLSIYSSKLNSQNRFNIFGGNITFEDFSLPCSGDAESQFYIYGYDYAYDPNARILTASLLYGGQITINHLWPPDYECLNLVVTPPAVVEIARTLRKKSETLDLIDRMLEPECAAYDALDELLQTGDYGGLTKSDVGRAKQRIHSAIQHELQSKRALEKSIDELNDALDVLNWQAPPYIPPPQ